MPGTPPSEPHSTPGTVEPRAQPESEAPGAEWDIPRVLDFGEAGTYRLEECLGRGGMGEVYRARQVGAAGFAQWVAIKRLRPGSRPREARSFVDEARVLSRLHHENIAHVYAFHEWKGSYYLVMECIEGRSLHALLELARQKGHRFSEAVACAVMADVADALHHAHHVTDEAGRPLHIVHRDVSPANILITGAGRVVLVDFGVALSRQEGRIATRTGSTVIKGKVPYLSPEQVKHLPLDARSDLFSVGTILVELLTGEAPFGWTADYITLKRIAAVTPGHVAFLLPGVSRPLRRLCQKLLAPNPDQRFATGREVAQALRQHAGLVDGRQSIQSEVERLEALPDAKTPPPAAEAAARALSGVKHARRVVTLAGALTFATLALVFWLFPRHAVPVPVHSAPPLQGHSMSLPRPPEKTPPSDLAPGEQSALAAVRAGQKAPIPLAATAPPAGERTGGSVHVSGDFDEATGQLPGEPGAALGQLVATAANDGKVSGEALSPQHALAALFATDNARLTHFFRVSRRQLIVNGVSAYVAIWKPLDDDDSGTVAVVVDLTNPDDAPPWEPLEGRIVSNARSSIGRPAAIQAMPRVIQPGQSGRVALVFNQSQIGEEAMPILVEVFRGSRPEFGMEISSRDLEEEKPLWKSLWPF